MVIVVVFFTVSVQNIKKRSDGGWFLFLTHDGELARPKNRYRILTKYITDTLFCREATAAPLLHDVAWLYCCSVPLSLG